MTKDHVDPCPCAHCGCVQTLRYAEDGAVQIACFDCGARGPRALLSEHTSDEWVRAVALWNRRPEKSDWRMCLLRDVCALLANPTTTIKDARAYTGRLKALIASLEAAE